MYCKICKNSCDIIFHKRRKNSYYVCSNCDFIFKTPDEIVDSKEEFKIYENHNNSIDDPKYVNYLKRFLKKAVLNFTNSDATVLDFGSGPSPVLAKIMQRDFGYKVDIYDLFYSPEKIYEGRKYDVITSVEVVEHLKDPLQYFKLFASLLTQDGILAIQTQFHPNSKEKFSNWYYNRDVTHISFYTVKTLTEIARISGLELIHTDNVRTATFTLLK